MKEIFINVITYIVLILLGSFLILKSSIPILGYGLLFLIHFLLIKGIYSMIKEKIGKSKKGSVDLNTNNIKTIYNVIINNSDKIKEGETLGEFILNNISSGNKNRTIDIGEKVLGFNKNIKNIRKQRIFGGIFKLMFKINVFKNKNGDFNSIDSLNEITFYLKQRSKIEKIFKKMILGIILFLIVDLFTIFGFIYYIVFKTSIVSSFEGIIVKEGSFSIYNQIFSYWPLGSFIVLFLIIGITLIISYKKTKKNYDPQKKLDFFLVNFIIYSFIFNSFKNGKLNYFNFQQILGETIYFLKEIGGISNSIEEQVYNFSLKNGREGFTFFSKIGNQNIGDNLENYQQQARVGELNGYHKIEKDLINNYKLKSVSAREELFAATKDFEEKVDGNNGKFVLIHSLLLIGTLSSFDIYSG